MKKKKKKQIPGAHGDTAQAQAIKHKHRSFTKLIHKLRAHSNSLLTFVMRKRQN